MQNPGSGRDDARYYAMAVMMAESMEPGDERELYRGRTLARLIDAVLADERRRACCRDTSVLAATRLRAW